MERLGFILNFGLFRIIYACTQAVHPQVEKYDGENNRKDMKYMPSVLLWLISQMMNDFFHRKNKLGRL